MSSYFVPHRILLEQTHYRQNLTSTPVNCKIFELNLII